jgi:glycosyltransferase involved in cell wall biosynthesis
MKITFVMTNASNSGGTRVIVTHAQQLMAMGHQVQAFSTAPPPPKFMRSFWSWYDGKGWLRPLPPGESFFDGSGVPHTVIPKFRPLTDRDLPDADVVIATWWESAEWVKRLSPSKGAKAFFIQHYETWGGPPKRVDATWRLPMQKIVISQWLADLSREKFNDPSAIQVPNSVDMNLFNAPKRGRQARPTVGMLYADQWFKGVDISLKAIEIARKEIPDLQLICFGEKPVDEWNPLPPGTTFFQKPKQTAIKEIYARCDIWLCGSRAEGFHLPPLEAMACRCPVVSTKVGGPLDTIVEGKNGFLVDIENPQLLADALVKALRLSEQQWSEMSDAAYATACRYTWKDAAILFEAALETAIAKSRGQGVGSREKTGAQKNVPDLSIRSR